MHKKNSSISNNSVKHKYAVLMSKLAYFNWVCLNTQFTSFWPIDRTLSGATTPGQSGLGSGGNEGVLHIPQSPCITGTPLSDCSVSYPGNSLGWGVLPLCREAVVVFYSPSRLDKLFPGFPLFSSMDKIQSFAQFLVDHLVEPCLVFLLG